MYFVMFVLDGIKPLSNVKMYCVKFAKSGVTNEPLLRCRVLCFVFLEPKLFLCVGNDVFTFCKICHVYLYSLVMFIKKSILFLCL